MNEQRLADYVAHIVQAAQDACDFVLGMSKEAFVADKRTQRAVVMSLVIVGEAATKLLDRHPDFAASHADVPWRSMQGMRNRVAHGYFDIDLDIVWDTVHTALPELLGRLRAIQTKEGLS